MITRGSVAYISDELAKIYEEEYRQKRIHRTADVAEPEKLLSTDERSLKEVLKEVLKKQDYQIEDSDK